MASEYFRNRNAFTLIEIMLVVIIISVLAAMVVPNLVGRGEQARVSATRADIAGNLATALDLYEVDNGKFPSTEEGLQALSTKPTTAESATDKWHGPYLKKKQIPLDAWGKEYIYLCPGTHNPESYDLSSLGADGVASSDDITNWDTNSKQ
ncbi:MAG: type II secretion system major pseudopilin GspG [Candidatus Omnitrophica bacterium]|nr:type II secretion system major pseudopilin GspG [Candidatus Omnitrophota bacterium]